MTKRAVDPNLPVVYLDDQLKSKKCRGLKQCDEYVRRIREKLIGRYIGLGQPTDGQIVAAWLDLRTLNYNQYINKVKKRYKGSVIRNARKADRQGYICKPFVRKLFIPDIVAINHSKEVRSGGPMRASYQKSVEEMGGPPKKFVDLQHPECQIHYDYWWGIFSPEPGYKQGDIVVNEKLLGYIDFRRIGNFALYSLILGHGDFLKYGIMYRLHFAIMEWICGQDNIYTQDLEHLIYAGFYQGGEGLQLWKKKTLFEPAYLVIQQ